MDQHETQGLNFVPPRNLIIALSMIQHWYVAESKGQTFVKEFFTFEHTMAFSLVAIKSAFYDTLIWITLNVLGGSFVYFIQQGLLTEQTTQLLFWQVEGSPFFWFIKLTSFIGLAFSSVLCILMARYYTGVVPKKAINAVFATRAIFLLCFAFVAFFIFGLLYKHLANEEIIRTIYHHISSFNSSMASRFYYFVTNYFRRALFESGIVAVVASILAIILPFLSIMLFRFYKRKKTDLGIEVE